MPGYRQEVFNVLLAQLLQERGVISAPEKIIQAGGERKMPDVIVSFNGLRTAIEGEVGGKPDAAERALASARRRVEDGIAHIGVAVVYAEELRRADFTQLKAQLAASPLDIAIVTESQDTGFARGNVDYLESALRHAFEHLVHEDVVARAVAHLDAGIDVFARAVSDKRGIMEKMADILGIRELPSKPARPEEDE